MYRMLKMPYSLQKGPMCLFTQDESRGPENTQRQHCIVGSSNMVGTSFSQ